MKPVFVLSTTAQLFVNTESKTDALISGLNGALVDFLNSDETDRIPAHLMPQAVEGALEVVVKKIYPGLSVDVTVYSEVCMTAYINHRPTDNSTSGMH